MQAQITEQNFKPFEFIPPANACPGCISLYGEVYGLKNEMFEVKARQNNQSALIDDMRQKNDEKAAASNAVEKYKAELSKKIRSYLPWATGALVTFLTWYTRFVFDAGHLSTLLTHASKISS